MLIITNEKDIATLKTGQSYFIDTFPDVSLEDQTVTQEMLDKREALEESVREHLQNLVVFPIYTKTDLNEMREADLVNLALTMGLQASVDDRKSDTVNKILKLQETRDKKNNARRSG